MFSGNLSYQAEEIEVHMRTYRSLLRSAGVVKINKLIDSHNSMHSFLHEKGATGELDMAAFIYVLLRLPSCMSNVKTVILAQSYSVFKNNGYEDIIKWQEVSSAGRRRKMYYNGHDKLAMYITSVTDVDDIITLLTAYQIEWNKFHKILGSAKNTEHKVHTILESDDLSKIQKIWGEDYLNFLNAIKHRAVDISVKLLSGSYVEYAKATQQWWDHIVTTLASLKIPQRPVYFVSSNTHSLTNLLTRFVINEEKKLINYLYNSNDANLISLWEGIKSGDFLANRENFLYYLAKKYAKADPTILTRKYELEKSMGIYFISALHYLDIDVQIIDLKKLKNATFDDRLNLPLSHLQKSDAIIINIDYPLGWAAYQVLTIIGQNVDTVRGVYIMGKAATLNGQIGDILLPNTVYDQHSKNIYILGNAFASKDFTNIFKTGVVLDNQKTVTVKGTFLQNSKLLESWFREGYTVIEMEGGPYMSAAYEFVYYNRYMENQFINLTNIPFELGIAHYASDTPYSKAKNLGVRSLSYEGIEPTYSISLAIIKKIVEKEKEYI